MSGLATAYIMGLLTTPFCLALAIWIGLGGKIKWPALDRPGDE